MANTEVKEAPKIKKTLDFENKVYKTKFHFKLIYFNFI